ncbi:MAG: sensor domain-containing diguanylate cyclase [Thermoanaerobaculia bacterium]
MSGIEIECLAAESLGPILERQRQVDGSREIPRFPLDTLLITILEKANEFVPSASGSILLDDPILKREGQGVGEQQLIFVCCFGTSAKAFLGERIKGNKGIAGAVYRTGVSRITNDAYKSHEFAHEFDSRTGHSTQSILCVAIRIGSSICGVIELVNRRGGGGYTEGERELLEIFAQYISSTIQNAVDAKRIAKVVRTDDLSGLSNDRFLHERLPLEVERSLRTRAFLSVIFLDLDRFKEINDAHGHLVGSATLAEFGHLLRAVVGRDEATLVRYGGDEFVVVLPGTDEETAWALAERIRLTTQAHCFLEAPAAGIPTLNLQGIITTSIGICTMIPSRESLVDTDSVISLAMRLLKTADEAMYASKARGKNVVTVAPFLG